MNKLLLVLLLGVFLIIGCGNIRNTPIPHSLVYVKLVNIKEVYDSTDFEKFIGYKVSSDTFSVIERAILLNTLKENNQSYVLGSDSSIYLPRSAVYNLETILSLNEELYKKLPHKDSADTVKR